jgi:magnesium chelatase family protein
VLFLDELTEFKRSTLEVLRQPMEGKKVLISRANMSIEYPASFLLVAALNPCPCGHFGDKKKQCVCSRDHIIKYFGKISGPLLDRIDLHVNVSSVDYEDIQSAEIKSKSSKEIFADVIKAVKIQEKRLGSVKNAYMNSEQVEQCCVLSGDAKFVLKLAFDKLGLSMRGYHKILKIGRTIADLENSEKIEKAHIQEAIMYRTLDKQKSL